MTTSTRPWVDGTARKPDSAGGRLQDPPVGGCVDACSAGNATTDERSIAVVAVTYNSALLIPEFIDMVHLACAGVRHRLIVVDNSSVDGTVDLVRTLAPTATVIETGGNAGYAAGINVGIAEAPEGWNVLALNPDVRLDASSVSQLLETLEVPGTGVAVPRIVDQNGVLVNSLRRAPSLPRAWADALVGARRASRWAAFGEIVMDPAVYRRPCVVEWAEGSVQLISAACITDCGGWDESFFLYSEETEYHLRVGDRGLTVRFSPQAQAVHIGGESRTSPRLWTLLAVNRVRLYRRRHGHAATALYWAAVVAREGSRAMIGSRTSRAAVVALLVPHRFRTAADAAGRR